MSANILHFTEQFDNAYWTPFDGLVVTPNTFAAPVFAGSNAGLADTVADTSAGGISSLYGTFESIPNDASSWLFSTLIRKDTTQTRFPLLHANFFGGTDAFSNIQINTQTGVAGNAESAPSDAFGVVDVDSNWWRLWMRKANNNTGNTLVRVALFPAYSATIGGVGDQSILGSIVAWGINATNDATLQDYQPNPTYAFTTATPFFTTIGARRWRK